MSSTWSKILQATAQSMSMDEETWQRHANPLSVYSRIAILPLMTLAIVSRIWLGWWALGLVALVCLWTWWNPRAFARPAQTGGWAAHGTFGERVLLNHEAIPVPAHHLKWAKGLSFAASLGIAPWIYGLWALDWGFMILGMSLIIGAKLWFVDRMVWLYQDMREASPEYAAWER